MSHLGEYLFPFGRLVEGDLHDALTLGQAPGLDGAAQLLLDQGRQRARLVGVRVEFRYKYT